MNQDDDASYISGLEQRYMEVCLRLEQANADIRRIARDLEDARADIESLKPNVIGHEPWTNA